MTVAADDFRSALRMFASGITLVTVSIGDAFYGMTCTSFASVSLDPPMVLVCLENDSHTLDAVQRAGSFAVSVLNDRQEDLARSFSTPGVKPFDKIDHRRVENGAPIVDGALAWLECSVKDIVAAGDHHVVLALVESCASDGSAPLLYFDRAYRRLK